MCGSGIGHDHGAKSGWRRRVSIEGDAVDPVALEPVDEVVITTLVDNSYDGLMTDMGPARRAAMGRTPRCRRPSSCRARRCRDWWPSTASRRW